MAQLEEGKVTALQDEEKGGGKALPVSSTNDVANGERAGDLVAPAHDAEGHSSTDAAALTETEGTPESHDSAPGEEDNSETASGHQEGIEPSEGGQQNRPQTQRTNGNDKTRGKGRGRGNRFSNHLQQIPTKSYCRRAKRTCRSVSNAKGRTGSWGSRHRYTRRT